ncbi:MAG: sulfur carrier protein ThiS [Lysobacteraceae bacterium]
MRIELNGEATDLPDGLSVAGLLEHTGLAGRRVAVEVNREVVPRSLHAGRMLADGDRVEIVHALGGG